MRVLLRREILCLLLRGGIEANPGPRYPCGGSGKEVGKGFSCACCMCGVWWHSKCSGLSARIIRGMSASHTWACAACSAGPEEDVGCLQVDEDGCVGEWVGGDEGGG